MKKIYWININRFDEKIDKSTWLEISEALINNKFSVTLLTGYKRKMWFTKKYKLKIKYFKAINASGIFKLSLYVLIFLWLCKNIKKNDIIILSTGDLWLGVLLKKIKKCKIHLDIRTVPVEIHNIKNLFDSILFYTIPLKLFNQSPDSYSFITQFIKQKIESRFNVHFKDYVIWTSGVNFKHFAVARTPHNKKEKRFVLTYLGVVTKNRGIDKVLKAFYKLNKIYKHKVVVQIIGDGPFLPYLKQMSLELGISNRVLFKGYIPYDSVPEHLIDTDCFICPLPDRPEWCVSNPLKVLEYLACAKPLILTPIVSHKNIINNNEFVIWTEGDRICDFTRAIEYAFKHRKSLSIKSRMAPHFIRNKYEWEIQGQKFSNYLVDKF